MKNLSYSSLFSSDLDILIVDNFFSLQVQSDHYDDFFSPELDKHGYYGLYKRKTNEVGAIFWSL